MAMHVFVADENNNRLIDKAGNYVTARIEVTSGFAALREECAYGGKTITVQLSNRDVYMIENIYSSKGLNSNYGECLQGLGYLLSSELEELEGHVYAGLYKYDPRYAGGGFDFIIDDYRFSSGNLIDNYDF